MEDVQAEIDEAIDYLCDGGMGEVMGFIEVARKLGQPKVQMDVAMADALVQLAMRLKDWPFPRPEVLQ